MDVIYFLIPLALILLICAVSAFMWAAKNGQFEDLDREAHRILFDEDLAQQRKNSNQKDNPGE
ncbi:MAG: cbb3-type cytochrome oxidase assembly protein CcoS [Gammaproteobacteria bacterium]|nr:MAG: cbb3-type cytochrome oxidase assembly protein CcoS [Gammaproteobacteria bacterium]